MDIVKPSGHVKFNLRSFCKQNNRYHDNLTVKLNLDFWTRQCLLFYILLNKINYIKKNYFKCVSFDHTKHSDYLVTYLL